MGKENRGDTGLQESLWLEISEKTDCQSVSKHLPTIPEREGRRQVPLNYILMGTNQRVFSLLRGMIEPQKTSK